MPETMTDPITAAQSRALRNADAIVFHHRDGQGYIRAIQRAEHSPTGFEQEVRVDAHQSSITDYHPPIGRDGDRYDAAVVFTSAQYHDTCRTLVKHLRTGQSFTLAWVRNNNSPVTNEAHMVRDELRIRIGKVDGKTADTFLVDVYVGWDNTARMVRWAVR